MRHCQCILLTDGLIDETSITPLMLFDSYRYQKEMIYLNVDIIVDITGKIRVTSHRAIFIYVHIEYNLDTVVYCYKVFRYLRSLSR